MNKICTSLEQSKKLIELGVDINTADMHHVLIDSDKEIYDVGLGNYIGILPHYPAWSLSALLEIIPNVEIKSKVQNFDNKSWCVSSHDDKDHNHIWAYNDELIDACVELIYKLKTQSES